MRLVVAVTLVLLRSGVGSGAEMPCANLATVKLEQTVLTKAESVAAGAFTLPGRGGAVAPFSTLPAFCRVAGAIHPTPDSDIRFEVWLPLEGWNGRFQGVGNGGLAGTISYPALAAALRDGYATASTDTGHSAEPPGQARWALGHPEKIRDYGNRAVHEMTVKAKAILAAFYGSGARRSYWNGCSTGGNQALSEAQRYPADYDGILAGAPANYMTHLQAGGNWISQALHADPAAMIPATKLPAIARAVLAACDAADGVNDGLLEDPRTCRFDPATLLCKAGETDECLTAPQAAGLKKVYDGARNPRTGDPVFPGYLRGGEAGWTTWIAGTEVPPRNAQHPIMAAFFQYFVFDDPSWDWKSFDFDKHVALADRKAGGDVNAIDPDLRKFRDRGGKVVQFHGWNDPAISPLNSINYFTSVRAKLGDTQEFYRLFMMPGVGHCGGGAGPSDFNRMSVIVDWVENGKAPDQIVASHAAGGKVDRTRPLCSYPKIAKYKGAGSIDDAANFVCTAP